VLSGHLTTQVAFTSLRTLKDVLLSDYLVVFGIVKWETGDFFSLLLLILLLVVIHISCMYTITV